MGKTQKRIAALCMEVGLEPEIYTYSGGLGILFGDMLKASADLGIPLDGYSLMYHKGNYRQKLKCNGEQEEEDISWYPERHMKKLDKKVKIKIYDKDTYISAWQRNIKGAKSTVPLYFLDANDTENPDFIRVATDHPYDGDRKRIYQEMILGMGAFKLSKELGKEYKKYHLNEGHCSFLIFKLMKHNHSLGDIIDKCVFTTHTPVEAGHEKFDYYVVRDILRDYIPKEINNLAGQDCLSMTHLALNCSGYTNAVSKKHAEVSGKMFDRKMDYITNGVHSETWASDSFKNLYDKHRIGWRVNSELLRNAKNITLEEIWNAHNFEKKEMIDSVYRLTGVNLDSDILTLGFARRVAKYKRADLIFDNIRELTRIGRGKLQLVFSGKAFPTDGPAKEIIKDLFNSIKEISSDIKCAYIPDYNMHLGKLLTSGCDVWLNNPLPPLEASGTSGMCAAVNGVPQLSTIDGWWCEGLKEDVTGWGIGKESNNPSIHPDTPEAQILKKEDAKSLYDKLENKIIPLYYDNRAGFTELMRNAISINASHFNAHRMMKEYAEKAYKIKI